MLNRRIFIKVYYFTYLLTYEQIYKKNSLPDYDDVEDESERHLRQHQVQRSVDVGDAGLIKRLTPVDQAEYKTHELQHISTLSN